LALSFWSQDESPTPISNRKNIFFIYLIFVV